MLRCCRSLGLGSTLHCGRRKKASNSDGTVLSCCLATVDLVADVGTCCRVTSYTISYVYVRVVVVMYLLICQYFFRKYLSIVNIYRYCNNLRVPIQCYAKSSFEMSFSFVHLIEPPFWESFICDTHPHQISPSNTMHILSNHLLMTFHICALACAAYFYRPFGVVATVNFVALAGNTFCICVVFPLRLKRVGPTSIWPSRGDAHVHLCSV